MTDTKTFYTYSRFNGIYAGPITVPVDPAQPDTFINPAFATEVAPPSTAIDEVAVWRGSAWEVVKQLTQPAPPQLTRVRRWRMCLGLWLVDKAVRLACWISKDLTPR